MSVDFPDLVRRRVTDRLIVSSVELPAAALARLEEFESLRRPSGSPKRRMLFYLVALAGLVAPIPIYGDEWLRISFSWWGVAIGYLVLVAASAIAMTPAFIVLRSDRSVPWTRQPTRKQLTFVLVWWAATLSLDIALLVATRAGALDDLSSWIRLGIGFGVLAYLAIVLVAVGGAVILATVQHVGSGRGSNPADGVLYRLLDVHTRVELLPSYWEDLDYRADLNQRLEGIGRTVEAISERLATTDVRVHLVLQEAFARRAAGIRELQVWIGLPRSDTREHLLHRIGDAAAKVAVGDWDGLPSRDEFPLPTKRRIQATVRTIVIAALPAIALVAIQLSSFRLDQPALDYATLGVAGWAILSILLWVDPGLPAKVSLYAQARELIKGQERRP